MQSSDRFAVPVLLLSALIGFPRHAAADEAAADLPAAIDRVVSFATDVQPLLQRTCYSCHGAEQQESGLRLDLKRRALEGGDGGQVIVPGDSATSRLVLTVAGVDDELGIMPPDGEGTPLTAEQIGILRGWIDQGAEWPDTAGAAADSTNHWSFQPIEQPLPPPTSDPLWVLNPIDAFVLARLEEESIAQSPPADRATLMRRLYLDLLGLPPAPDDMQRFLNDSRPGAYERLVERVLASPHYGERWGRHWLDLARYADSDGYEKDRPRPHAWRYRNWVLEALNSDLPYDRFSIAQIAGDMLPDASTELRVASGLHRNTLHNTEGGTDQEEDRVKKTVDRTNTLGTIWLGMTVGCSQCHSHKYDPLTQREYYQLYAFFNSINEVDIDAPPPVELERYQRAKQLFDEQHAELEAAVAEYERTKLDQAQAAWEPGALASAVVWQPFDATAAVSRQGATLEQQSDRSWLAKGANKDSDVYTIETVLEQPAITAIRLEVLPDDSLVKKGPGRADNGNFVLATFRLTAAPARGDAEGVAVQLHRPQADFSQQDWPVAAAINDNPADGWAVSPQFGKRHVAVFETAQPVGFEGGTRLTVVLDQNYQGKAHNLGRFRLSVTSSAAPITLDGMPDEVAKALALAGTERTPEQSQLVRDYFRSVDPELLRLKQIVAKHTQQAPKSPGIKAQVVAEASAPRAAHIHIRGDFLNQGDPVQPATPAVLPALQPRNEQPNRLDLAEWVFVADNPLTARVTVNRIWQHLFGRGITNTVDNFGTQGDPPSHPELLDWLAAEFRDNGWSIKHIQRLMVTSNTYRQSSAVRRELADVDPENALLARQTRRRVEAEIVRDLALAASGLLDERLGGPSVRPPQPAEYSRLTYANSAKWEVSKHGDAYRRGLYTFFQRTSPYPLLMTFDSPDSNACCAARSMSNTPLQALTLWNDPAFFECAQALGRRIMRDVPSGAAHKRAAYAFQLCLSRPPGDAELGDVLALFEELLAAAGTDSELATSAIGQQPLPANASAEELAAWIIVGRTLMNLDEFITRE